MKGGVLSLVLLLRKRPLCSISSDELELPRNTSFLQITDALSSPTTFTASIDDTFIQLSTFTLATIVLTFFSV